MNFRSLIVAALLALPLAEMIATPGLAQPFDQNLPESEVLELSLWSTDLSLKLESGSQPHLVVQAFQVDGAGTPVPIDHPTVELREEGSTLLIRRVAPAEQVRLRAELTLGTTQPVVIRGRDLQVDVQGPVLDLTEMAMLRDRAHGRGEDLPAPEWTEVTLDLEDSRADLHGLSGALLIGYNAIFTSRQSTNELQLDLEESRAEIEQHRGKLDADLVSAELVLHDAKGLLKVEQEQGSFQLSSSEGRLEATLEGVSTSISDWKGQARLEPTRGALEMRSFRSGPQMLRIKALGTEVTLGDLDSGNLDLDQREGTLRIHDVDAEIKLKSSRQAQVELEALKGAVSVDCEEVKIAAQRIRQLHADLRSSHLELAEVGSLSLRAEGSEIEAFEITRLDSAMLTNSNAEIELARGPHGEIEASQSSRATITMQTPCFVLPPRGIKFDEAFTQKIFGCVAGPDLRTGNVRDERPKSMFTAKVEEGSEMTVRGF